MKGKKQHQRTGVDTAFIFQVGEKTGGCFGQNDHDSQNRIRLGSALLIQAILHRCINKILHGLSIYESSLCFLLLFSLHDFVFQEQLVLCIPTNGMRFNVEQNIEAILKLTLKWYWSNFTMVLNKRFLYVLNDHKNPGGNLHWFQVGSKFLC